MSSPSRGKQGLFTFLRLGLAALILIFVFRSVPWRDRLEYVGSGGETAAVEGSLHGDWKADRVRFELAPEETVPASFPPAFAEALARGSSPELSRWSGRPGETGFDWKPGMPSIVKGSDRTKILQALVLLVVGICLVVTRWRRLLGVVGCATSWWNALRLTMIGLFFNSVVPGLTGGDVVKAVLVVRENPNKRADALISVIVDRLLGMVSLATLAAVLILFSGDTFAELKLPMSAFLAAAFGGSLLYAAPRLRELVRFDALLDRMPLGDKLRALDEAVLVYFRRPRELAIGFGLSLLNHGVTVGGAFWFGRAFGIDEATAGLREFFVVVPVGNIVSALPLAPAGWGLGEFIYKYLFEMIGSDGAMGVAISVAFRLSMTLFGLLGGLFLLLPGNQAEVHQARAEA